MGQRRDKLFLLDQHFIRQRRWKCLCVCVRAYMRVYMCVCVRVCVCGVFMSREEPSFPGKCLLHLRVGELLGLIEFANTNYQQPSNMICQCWRFRLATSSTSSKTVNKTICSVKPNNQGLVNNQVQQPITTSSLIQPVYPLLTYTIHLYTRLSVACVIATTFTFLL